MADRRQSEISGIYLIDRNPKAVGSIVGCFWFYVIRHTHKKVGIEGMDIHSTIQILVRHRVEISHLTNFQPRFFLYFTPHAILNGFIHIHETADKVKRTFGGFLTTTDYQHFITRIQDKRRCSRTRISVEGEATILALLALEIMLRPMGAATCRTIFEFI